MRRFVMPLLAVLALALALATTALATPGLKLDHNAIGPNQCAGGTLLVDVHYTLLNDQDSGFGGNYWANDTIYRHLMIWQTTTTADTGTTYLYCVSVDDTGSFVTYQGLSPSGLSTVSAGVTGQMHGGYITYVNGTFDAGANPVSGAAGTYDIATAPSILSWASYFDAGYAADTFVSWGWIYDAGTNGTWLNQQGVLAADSGDITG